MITRDCFSLIQIHRKQTRSTADTLQRLATPRGPTRPHNTGPNSVTQESNCRSLFLCSIPPSRRQPLFTIPAASIYLRKAVTLLTFCFHFSPFSRDRHRFVVHLSAAPALSLKNWPFLNRPRFRFLQLKGMH